MSTLGANLADLAILVDGDAQIDMSRGGRVTYSIESSACVLDRSIMAARYAVLVAAGDARYPRRFLTSATTGGRYTRTYVG